MAVRVIHNGALNKLASVRAKVKEAVPNLLAEVGERFCSEARATKTYTDRTGNLTASIGYGVVIDGAIVRTGGFGSGEGAEQGMLTLNDALSILTLHNPTLIVVAGMNYALYVERRGYAVLDGARFNFDKILQDIKKALTE